MCSFTKASANIKVTVVSCPSEDAPGFDMGLAKESHMWPMPGFTELISVTAVEMLLMD